METRLTGLTMEQAIQRVTEALAQQGFGILTTIDTQAAFRKKLGIETHPRVILGACNPPFALETLRIDPAFSLLMPCNVVVEDPEGDGTIRVSAIDPREMAGFSRAGNDPRIVRVMEAAQEKLEQALKALG